MDAVAQLLRRSSRRPAALGVTIRADLCDDAERVWVRVKCLFDELIGDVGPVRVAGVDVGDAQLHHLAQDADCSAAVGRRSHHAGACQLHCAVAETGELELIGERKDPAG